MRFLSFSLAWAGVLLAAAWAAEPPAAEPAAVADVVAELRELTLDVTGPAEAEPGRLVVLDSADIPATARAWHLLNPPADDNHQVVHGGEQFIFSTRYPGRYWVVFAFSVPDRPGVVILPRLLTITGKPGPPGPDNPDPPGPDAPVIPDRRYKLARVAFVAAGRLADRSRAADVAAVHRAVASRIAAGGVKGIDAALSLLNEQLRARLAADFAVWTPWGRAVMGSVLELYKSEQLKTPADLADALEEIADGLEVVK